MNNLNKLFQDKNEIEKHIQNLRTTVSGLHKIYKERQDLRELLLPQLQTLDDIKSALTQDYNYCFYEGFTNNKTDNTNTVKTIKN